MTTKFKVAWSLSGETYLHAKDAEDAWDRVLDALDCTDIGWVASGSKTHYDPGGVITGVFPLNEVES